MLMSQVLSSERLAKRIAESDRSDALQDLSQPERLRGLTRVYQPRRDSGENLPAEGTRVQVRAADAITDLTASLAKLFDVTASKDWGNRIAAADVIIDGEPLLRDVPPSYLMFLEKQISDLRHLIGRLPILDVAFSWEYSPESRAYRTPGVVTTKTVKVPRNHVKADATERHPAQVELYYEDEVIGDWTTVRFSGALPEERVKQLSDRADGLLLAVRLARERANATEVEEQHPGRVVLDYLFG